jgi:hypothetical protein
MLALRRTDGVVTAEAQGKLLCASAIFLTFYFFVGQTTP